MDKKSLLSFIHYVGNSSVQGKNFSIESKNNSLILITAAGQITGTFYWNPTLQIPKSK